jgi:hypothetical protein
MTHRTHAVHSNPPRLPLGLLQTLGLVGLASLCTTIIHPATPPPQTTPITPSHRIELFNGTNLHGFYSWLVDTRYADPRRVFTVTNGQLRISGDGLGYLATSNTFANYRLTLEFKWGTVNTPWNDRIGRARDSGIFLHATGPDGNSHDGNGAFMAALECNLFQGATGDFLLIRGTDATGALIAPRATTRVRNTPDPEGWFYYDPKGRPHTLETWGRLNWFGKATHWSDTLDFRGPHDLEHPYGEWNQVECLAHEDRITIKINGTIANQITDIHPRNGRILLQCEGSEIFFRRLQLHPVPSQPPALNSHPS